MKWKLTGLCLALALSCLGTGCGPRQTEAAGPSQGLPSQGQAAPSAGVGRNDPSPSMKTTGAPTPTTPEPSPEPDHGAGMTAGEDYDFAQPVPETETVEDSYFDDAVFIGDSRVEGFRLYSGILNGTFLSHTGMSVFHMDREITYQDEKTTVLAALGREEYGKVYVSLGINELGMYNDKGYYDHYAQLVDDIRACQPQATIYIQLLVPVNTQRCAETKQAFYVTNEQIGVYNGLLTELAQEKKVFLLDPAEDLCDETGEPPYDNVADGVHFKKVAYQQWLDYLKRHTVDKGEWE